MGGAATGAAVGSVVPGYGTAIGAGVGAVAGGLAGYLGSGSGGSSHNVNSSSFDLPGFNSQYGNYKSIAGNAAGRKAPMASDSDYRKYQSQLLLGLRNDFNGNGPGQQLVRMQAQQAADRAAHQQLAMARSGRPGQTGMAGTNAAFNAANAQSAVGGQAAMAGLQARLMAGQQLGQFSGQARGQDIQNNQFNSDMRLRQMGLNDATQLEALRQRMQLSGMQQQGGISYEQIMSGNANAAMSQPTAYERMFGAASQGAETYARLKAGQSAPASGAPSGPQNTPLAQNRWDVGGLA